MIKDDGESIVDEAREFFARARDADAKNRLEAIDDLKFVHGEQWPEAIKRERERDGRPTLTINKLPQFCKQVINDIRQNRPQIKVRAVDDVADIKTADVYNGLIRNIEANSGADMAYDTASEYAVKAGIGFFRITTAYTDDDMFDQDIVIKPIRNPFTVYLDPTSVLPDYSDQKRCIVTERMQKDKFEAQYPNAISEWEEESTGESGDSWCDDETVRVAEFWCVEEEPATLCLLSDGSTVSLKKGEKYKAFEKQLAAKGMQCLKTREVKQRSVTQYIVTGKELLETNKWAGKYIPIFPVVGEEYYVEGERKRKSLIRDAKDAQRMYNYWRSASTEQVALAPKSAYIAADDAIAGYEAEWSNANVKNQAYLRYKSGTERPTRDPMPEPSQAMIAEITGADQDLYSTTGIYPANLGQKGPETSGRAILARQKEGDVSTFHFQDNLTRAIRFAGRVLVDLIPRIYDTARVIRVLNFDGTSRMVQINQEYLDPASGSILKHDLAAGKYDVQVDVGPSYTTQRQEAAESMMEAAQMNPQLMQIAGDILVKSMDWPHAEEIADRIKQAQQQAQQGGQEPPEIQAVKMQQQIEGMKAQSAQQLQQQKLHSEFQLKQMELQQEQQLEEMRLNFEAQKAGIEYRIDLARNQAKINFEREKHSSKLAADQAVAFMQGQAGQVIDGYSQLDGETPPLSVDRVVSTSIAPIAESVSASVQQTQQLLQTVAQLVQAIPAQIDAIVNVPKTIIYDKQGRVIGAQPNRTVQ